MRSINYGIDAPKVIRNLIGIGILLMLIFFFLPEDLFPPFSAILKSGSFMPGLFLILTGLGMIVYAKFGKFKHRDRILGKYKWRGNENVLDVGTGLGLLMIGAAKKLTTGTSYGIDIFNTYDLSIEQAIINSELELVTEKVKILKENILKTNFEDNFFDVIVSNLCLHNLYKPEERAQACKEIFRILKPNGKVIISDFKYLNAYKATFEELGMTVEKSGPFILDTFPPLSIIAAVKKQFIA
jgi:arsenite methyltransferase